MLLHADWSPTVNLIVIPRATRDLTRCPGRPWWWRGQAGLVLCSVRELVELLGC